MKKLLLMTAFLLPMVANAQLGSLVEQPLGGSWGSIVRVWQDSNRVLSYGSILLNQQSALAFCLSDYPDFYATPPSPPMLTVNYANLSAAFPSTSNMRFTNIRDMRIVDNFAFVCGNLVDTNYPMNPRGAIGWFKMNNFAAGNVNFYYFEIPQVRYLKKIAVYNNGQNYTVMAAGMSNFGDCIVEVPNAMTYPPCSYSIGYLGSNEVVDDILVNSTDVFFVGHQSPSGGNGQLFIRKIKRINGLADPYLHLRYDYPASINEINGWTYSTLMGDEQIATAYVNPNGAGTMVFPTRIRMISTTTMNMVNSQEITKENKWEPEEIIYLDRKGKLVLLQEIDKVWTFTILDPRLYTSYTTNYLYFPDQTFYSLDGDHDDLFVSTGTGHWLYFQRQGMTLPSPNGCPKNDPIKVEPIQNIPTVITNSSVTIIPPSSPVYNVSIVIDTLPSSNICSSPLH